MTRLEGKVAIITGGASGIGESAVHLFWEHGAKVVIADIQDITGQAIADKLGENVSYMHCNVSNEDEIINLVDSTIDNYSQLDIMYNNAGIIDCSVGSILDTTKEDLERVLGVNMVGSFLGAKHAARVMVPKKNGCILFTASATTAIAGLSSHPYAMSKCGILGLMKNLAVELGQHGIRVNCVSPYAVVTNISQSFMTEEQKVMAEMHLMKMGNLQSKPLKTIDVANSALFLASDESGFVSGLNLIVDGGYSVVNPTFWKSQGFIK